jgi:hypothetical protein
MMHQQLKGGIRVKAVAVMGVSVSDLRADSRGVRRNLAGTTGGAI